LFSTSKSAAGLDNHDDEADLDPDAISGLHAIRRSQLPRDPDALSPKNMAQSAGLAVHNFGKSFATSNILFAIKGSVLVGILLIPSVLPSFASRYYQYKAIWAPVLASMTLLRFVGDTAHGFSSKFFHPVVARLWLTSTLVRLLGTLLGACLGLAVWEISRGNPYGLVSCAHTLALQTKFA